MTNQIYFREWIRILNKQLVRIWALAFPHTMDSRSSTKNGGKRGHFIGTIRIYEIKRFE
jgi:hypothetical protein